MRDGDVEPTRVVQNALDVLAQVIVASGRRSTTGRAPTLFDLVRTAYPYHDAHARRVRRSAGDAVGQVSVRRRRRARRSASRWDRVDRHANGLARAVAMIAVISGGTIPDRGLYTVNLPDRTRLGELDEEFVHETRVGDVFQLGSIDVARSTPSSTIASSSRRRPARPRGCPSGTASTWRARFTWRQRIGELRRAVARGRSGGRRGARRARALAMPPIARRSLARRVRPRAASASCGSVPDDRELVLEQFRDEVGAVRLVLHAPFGGRVNAPWGMALAQRVRDALSGIGNRDGNAVASRVPIPIPESDVQVQTTDDGIMLRLPNLGGRMPDRRHPRARRPPRRSDASSTKSGARRCSARASA